MDQTGLYFFLGVLSFIGLFVIAGVWWWRRQNRDIETARSWPATEATIESGALEQVQDGGGRNPIILPVLAFSYQVLGEYYSGRFSLSEVYVDRDELIRKMIGRKLQIRYEPSSPEVWYIPDERIDGYKVEQKTGPHVIALYPRD